MTYILLIALSLLVTFLLLKFIDKIFYIFGAIFAIMVIGFLIIPLNPDLGSKIAAYSFAVLACAATIALFSSCLSAIVVTPVMILWKCLKGLFN